MDSLLEVKGLCKHLDGRTVLGACSFSLAPGHITGLLGPNGAGKSTLLRAIAGLWRPDGGEILLHGRPITRRDRPKVAYMADRTLLPRDLTVLQAVRWYRDLFPGLDPDRFRAVSGNLPEGEPVSRLSKGQAERLDLGLLLARNADLYLLDEPLGGVDPVERAKILSAAAGVMEDHNALLMATHLVHDIEPILDDVLFLRAGHVVLSASAEGLRQREGVSVEEKYMEVFGGGGR